MGSAKRGGLDLRRREELARDNATTRVGPGTSVGTRRSLMLSSRADNAGRPVYLDLEDEVLDAIRHAAEPNAAAAAPGLVEAVKNTLILRSGASQVFARHLHRLRRWHDGTMLDSPPTLALLAVLSLAAETMHEGEGMKPHNFYGRLRELLELDNQSLNRVRNAYRKSVNGIAVSASLWDSLNDWLEMLEGNRGLPTAFAISHEHIGLPLSQALVRQADRERFDDLFILNSLPPRSSLPTFDMELLIKEWMSKRLCPVSNTLERLWHSNAEARSRITDVAVQTLESWGGSSDGRPRGTSLAAIDIVRARVNLRSFPSRSLDVGLVIPARTTEAVEVVEAIDAHRSIIGSLELIPAASGYLCLADNEAIDTASFLAGEVVLKRPGQSQPLRRRSRRAVPMRYDEFLLSWVECERVQLGEESLVLVRSEIVSSAIELLHKIARPGFVLDDRMRGLPDGWTLVSAVQILSSIPLELRNRIPVDLNVLQPLSSSQLVLQGGLRLPGNIEKWSTSLPPEVRVTGDATEELTAAIAKTRKPSSLETDVGENKGSGGVLIWDLARASLGDGDYEIRIRQGDRLTRTRTLRLRSANSPAVVVDDDLLPIAHDPEALDFGLAACRTRNESAFRGAEDVGVELQSHHPPPVPAWYSVRRDRSRPSERRDRVRFPAPRDSSCMVTGGHVMSIETAQPGMSRVEGVCRDCGLIKRYPAFHGKKKPQRAKPTAETPPKIGVSGLVPVRVAKAVDWATAFDAVCHVGAGPTSALARIAAQMESNSLFGDEFERKLEQLGHIEIERSQGSLTAANWEVVEPLLVGLSNGSAIVIGFRSGDMMFAVEDHVRACRGTYAIVQVDAPPIIRVAGLTEVELGKLTNVMGEATRRRARFIPRAAEQLCSVLPPLSKSRTGLPATTSTKARSYEAWDPAAARFEPTQDASYAGAFRLTGFTRTYIYRTQRMLVEWKRHLATLGS